MSAIFFPSDIQKQLFRKVGFAYMRLLPIIRRSADSYQWHSRQYLQMLDVASIMSVDYIDSPGVRYAYGIDAQGFGYQASYLDQCARRLQARFERQRRAN